MVTGDNHDSYTSNHGTTNVSLHSGEQTQSRNSNEDEPKDSIDQEETYFQHKRKSNERPFDHKNRNRLHFLMLAFLQGMN
jgi:hypothetical protein